MNVVVMVADPVVGRGLQSVFAESGECSGVTLTTDLDELDALLRAVEDPVLILDVEYRRADDSLVHRLCEQHPSVTILVYIRHSYSECAIRHFFKDGDGVGLTPEAAVRLDD